jgi:pantoate--beta-alanine ligase
MLQVQRQNELRSQIRQWRTEGHRIAFVPTMGNLHPGHLSLLELARNHADRLVGSIFVNPMQFGANEDLDKYPRTLKQDCQALNEYGCDLLYLPSEQDLYPAGLQQMTRVEVAGIGERLEGEYRPGHLTGVSTIVTKLFNLVQPDMAVFGKKDYQQWRMIAKLVEDLNLPIEIIPGDTVRESDGLAMSSRNQYLSSEERSRASQLYRTLKQAAEKLRNPQGKFNTIRSEAKDQLKQSGFSIDYVDICERRSLRPAQAGDEMVILAAVFLGSTRLIDNIEV